MATQDRALRAALGKVSGGASIFASVNGLHLEHPTSTQSNLVRKVGGASNTVWELCLNSIILCRCRCMPFCLAAGGSKAHGIGAS